jgi:hypothetical protein
MFHRFQNIHGISYTTAGDIRNIPDEIAKLILDIINDKKLPFTDVYVRLPAFLFQKFMDQVRESNLQVKEMESRKNIFLVKF